MDNHLAGSQTQRPDYKLIACPSVSDCLLTALKNWRSRREQHLQQYCYRNQLHIHVYAHDHVHTHAHSQNRELQSGDLSVRQQALLLLADILHKRENLASALTEGDSWQAWSVAVSSLHWAKQPHLQAPCRWL